MIAVPGPALSRTLRFVALGLMLAGTSACVRIGAKPPEQLLSINAEARLAAGAPQSASAQSALFVELPDVPRTLATQRVAVRASANSFAYVPKALWADTPARQFQSLLGETIAARTGRLVLDPGQYLAQSSQILHGDLLEFGVDATGNKAVVTFDASLLAADGQTVRRQRFSASRPVSDIDADHVAGPISAAANEVATQIADWVGKP
ncbi:MAG: membrane integrity-associated transporter subunit PqiC [Sphingobium sp.]|nr:membrane integrity-associated transporter subunit PqiC [Sphingobium sp.]